MKFTVPIVSGFLFLALVIISWGVLDYLNRVTVRSMGCPPPDWANPVLWTLLTALAVCGTVMVWGSIR